MGKNQIVLAGISGSGKSVFYAGVLGIAVPQSTYTIQTIGPEVSQVLYDAKRLSIVDTGAREQYQQLNSPFLISPNALAVIFFVDATRPQASIDWIQKTRQKYTVAAPIFFMISKSECAGAERVHAIKPMLETAFPGDYSEEKCVACGDLSYPKTQHPNHDIAAAALETILEQISELQPAVVASPPKESTGGCCGFWRSELETGEDKPLLQIQGGDVTGLTAKQSEDSGCYSRLYRLLCCR